jgi:putative intracellular protease/amidase
MSKLAPHRLAMLAFADAQVLDVVGPLEVFSRAGRLLSDEGRRGPSPYTVEILARSRGTVVTSSGIGLVATRSFRGIRGGIDTLFVAGGRGVEAALRDASLIRWLRRMSREVGRLASVSTGAFVLAEAGVLDGKRAATHWHSCAHLAGGFPARPVRPVMLARGAKMKTSIRVAATAVLVLATGAYAATAVPIPTGQQITPTAAPGSTFVDLNPGLPDRPAYTAGQAVTSYQGQTGGNVTVTVFPSGESAVRKVASGGPAGPTMAHPGVGWGRCGSLESGEMENVDPWHGQWRIPGCAGCTVQPRCVHVPSKATTPPSLSRARMIGPR